MFNRVCIRTDSGQFVAAGHVNRLGEWVPVPEDAPNTHLLKRADALRPTGVHPALWYERWPGPIDTRDDYTLTTYLGETFYVRGYSLPDALREAGLRHAAVKHATMTPRWY